MVMTFHGRGTAKLLLFGEHAAVYGYPAVGLSLPDSTTVELTPLEIGVWSAPGLDAEYRPWFDALTGALDQALRAMFPEFPVETVCGRVTITSHLPVGRGFGSSAALCVALAAAALAALDAAVTASTTDTATIWRLANRLERVFHGTPSGVDTGLAVREGVSAFFFEGDELPRAETIPTGGVVLVTGAVPRSAGTRELVTAVRRRMDAGDPHTGEILARLGSLANEAIDLIPTTIGANSVTRLAHMVNEAEQLLEALGLGHPELNRCLSIGRNAGARAGKLSGAGGGGAFYLLCDEPRSARAVAAELANAGVERKTIHIVRV
jgi:mevalonate kinase